MAETYMRGSGDEVNKEDLSEHAQRIKDSRRSSQEQAELDLIWGDD